MHDSFSTPARGVLTSQHTRSRALLHFLLPLALSACLALPGILQAQCPADAYLEEVYTVDTVSDVRFGRAAEDGTELFMDVYLPQNDSSSQRPLVVLAHGGAFFAGSKTNPTMQRLASSLARRGYVAASVQYRLLNFLQFPFPNGDSLVRQAVRAIGDYKAALRWFYRSVKDSTNPYRIDTNHVYGGGSSAGAFIALHTAYVDKMSEAAELTDTAWMNLNGGLEGESGNPGYSARIEGVINLCGALGKAEWLEPGNAPVVSVHGTDDQVVPYAEGTPQVGPISLAGNQTFQGSSLIHTRAESVAVASLLRTYPDQPHVPYESGTNPDSWEGYYDDMLCVVSGKLHQWRCGAWRGCGNLEANLDSSLFETSGALTSLAERMAPAWSLGPNPSQGALTLESNFPLQAVQLFDLQGRLVMRQAQLEPRRRMQLPPTLPAGIYLLRGQLAGHPVHQRIWLQRP